MNYESQPLQPHEIEAMKADDEIMDRVVRSYRLMLDFYGMRLQSRDTGLLSRAPNNVAERYTNLCRKYRLPTPHGTLTARAGSSHNNLRISRILKCLSELGLEHLAAGFLLHVLSEQSENGELNTSGIRSSIDRWWANCLRHEQEREWIGGIIRKVRTDVKYRFTREMYQRALKRREETGSLRGEDAKITLP